MTEDTPEETTSAEYLGMHHAFSSLGNIHYTVYTFTDIRNEPEVCMCERNYSVLQALCWICQVEESLVKFHFHPNIYPSVQKKKTPTIYKTCQEGLSTKTRLHSILKVLLSTSPSVLMSTPSLFSAT